MKLFSMILIEKDQFFYVAVIDISLSLFPDLLRPLENNRNQIDLDYLDMKRNRKVESCRFPKEKLSNFFVKLLEC